MRRNRRRVHQAGRLALVGGLISAGVVACATTTGSPGPGGDSAAANGPVISAAAGAQLCDTMWADLAGWREQGSAIARVRFNGVVHLWALRNGAINIAVARHRDAIDAVTRDQCPNARRQVAQIIDTVDLASGLVGF
ncbi:hypothetical protein QX204_17310 [Nocardia sp. PE-7]|uniref:hypothetical protein n=1 Tax=Nocardia sp. PE-7 TaxID=3058426 RepID=UPI002658849C|nr:hypothetical protein [Nocardia sp. PE-7]WKG06879.1 hypothetical protein QX204_17310 [Nocardia sp. PE-7]